MVMSLRGRETKGTKNILSQIAGKGRITAQELEGLLGRYIDTSVLLSTESTMNYKNFAKMKGIQHEALMYDKPNTLEKGFTIFITSMNRFQSVATRYLDNYLFWLLK